MFHYHFTRLSVERVPSGICFSSGCIAFFVRYRINLKMLTFFKQFLQVLIVQLYDLLPLHVILAQPVNVIHSAQYKRILAALMKAV